MINSASYAARAKSIDYSQAISANIPLTCRSRWAGKINKQLLLGMKLTAVLLLLACLQVGAKGYGQGTVTISLRDVLVTEVFKEIEKQTSFRFLYRDELVKKAGMITITMRDATVEQVLNKCFDKKPLEYKIFKETIVISERSDTQHIGGGNGMFEVALTPIDVKGRVINEEGSPVDGVTVTIKGSKFSTVTDIRGEFELSSIEQDAVLVFTHVNMETFEVKVSGKKELVVNLTTKYTALKNVEVINTGYQKYKPNEINGSVVHVSNELINRTLSTDILTRLNGIASGVLFPSGTGNYIGQRENIVIRGYSTVLSNRQPLIVVDNFPFEADITTLNPNDVESITILRDAASASIWGTKAGNGVIVITTKSGRYNQKARVSVNSNLSTFENPDFSYQKSLGSSDYIDVEEFLFDNGFYDGKINSPFRPALTPAVEILVKNRNGEITDQEAAAQLNSLRGLDARNDLLRFYKRSVMQQHAVSISGGGANNNYFFSAGFDRNVGMSSNYHRVSMNGRNSHLFFKNKIEVTTQILYSQSRSDLFPGLSAGYPYQQLADANGNPLPVYRKRQGYIDTAGAGYLLDWNYYPLKEIELADNMNTSQNYRINASVKYKILKGLDIEARYMYEKQLIEVRNHQSINSYATRDYINQFSRINWTSGIVTRPVPLGGILDTRNTDYTAQNFRLQLNYVNTLWNDHRINFMGGVEANDATTDLNSFRYYGYDDEMGTSIPVDVVNPYPTYITGGGEIIQNGQSIAALYRRGVSFFANAAYTYNNKYSVSLSARKDGSNIFGATVNNRWKPLWSVGASWNISEEEFYKIAWLPELRLRGSYGYQGNVNNSIPALLTITASNQNKWNLPSAVITNSPNSNLRWEQIGMFNIGLDFATGNNRLSGGIEFYLKRGIDLIGAVILPPSTGSPVNNKTNSANIKGKGFDLTFNTVNTTGKISWRTIIQFSYAQDRVTEYKLKLPNMSAYVFGNENPVVGNPVTAIYSYRWAGLDPSTGDPQGYLDGAKSKDYVSLINTDELNDIVYNGPGTAPYFGNFLNTIAWKRLSVSLNITYKLGYYFRRPSIDYDALYTGSSIGHIDYQSRWQKSGDELITNVPSLVFPANSGPNTSRDLFYTFSEILVEKGDHIRLQDIQLSYDINKSQFSKFPFSNVRIYAVVSNIAILWRANKVGIDPDYVLPPGYLPGLPGKRISAGIKIDF